MRANRRSRRWGFTLIEMVTVLTMLIALGGTSLAILRTLHLTRQTSMARAISVRDVQRFADKLREITHAGASVVVNTDGRSLVLTDDEYQHTFAVDGASEAIQYVAEPQRDDSLARHDRFALGDATEVEFRFEASQSLVEVELTHRRRSSPPLIILAMVDEGASP